MSTTPKPLTFAERISAIQVDLRSVGNYMGEPGVDDLETDLEMVGKAASELAGLVGVLSDLIGSRTATDEVQAVEAAHAKERFARLALAAVAEEFPCCFPKEWSGGGSINDPVEPDDIPELFVTQFIDRFERQQARREGDHQ